MYKPALALCAATTIVLGLAAPASASAHRQTSTSNLIHNGNAEAAAGSSDGSTVPVPDWTITTGTTFTAVQYGASGGFPFPTDPGPARRGANFLAGGPGDAVSAATQTRPIKTSFRAPIDDGTAVYTLQGFLGGFESQADNATVEVDFLTAHNAELGSATIGPVTAADRNDLTGLKLRRATGSVPVGTRKVLVTLTMTRTDGSYNDGYADNLSLKITVPS